MTEPRTNASRNTSTYDSECLPSTTWSLRHLACENLSSSVSAWSHTSYTCSSLSSPRVQVLSPERVYKYSILVSRLYLCASLARYALLPSRLASLSGSPARQRHSVVLETAIDRARIEAPGIGQMTLSAASSTAMLVSFLLLRDMRPRARQ